MNLPEPHADDRVNYRPPVDYDLHHLAGIGYHLAIGLDLDRYDRRVRDLWPAWYVVDVPPAGPGIPAKVEWFATQAEALAHAANRLLQENEDETGDLEHQRLAVVAV